MRITCPYCGERDVREFSYLGGEPGPRPEGLEADAHAMFEHVYQRPNPAGPIREYWYHTAGCHSWLIVERDTRTHAIGAVTAAANREVRS